MSVHEREDTAVTGDSTGVIGQSPAIQALLATVKRLTTLAQSSGRPPAVLIQGETGSGKGLVASLLHRAGPRGAGRFVDVNCAAIPESLIEAELFGFERGAFTDARRAKPGLFQAAHRGTIFLDEVGLLPESLQAKLLKVIEERAVRRLGSTDNEPADAWIISATNADLLAKVRARTFREDLYHRLAVVTLVLPPLRERAGDIALLARHFLAHACADHGLPLRELTPAALAKLSAYPWPGNVRELANVMERVALLSDAPRIDAPMLDLGVAPTPASPPPPAPPAVPGTLDEVVRAHIQEVLEHTGGNISRTATLLGISRNTLRAHLDKLGMRPSAMRTPKRVPEERPAPRRAPAPSGTPVVASPPAGPLRWERRLITVLRVALDAPAETAAFQLAPLLEELIAKVKSFSARVEEVTPLGLVAVFGFEPMEDAPSRATHVALAMLKAVQRAGAGTVRGLQARLAIHAGARLIAHGGDVTGMDPMERGEVWAILDRLLALAPADAVVVDSAAAPLIERRFALDPPRGTVSPPPQVYRVAGHERTGFEVGGRVLSRFVGRDRDLALLLDRLTHVEAGRGQVVGLVGEPGVGKSRLLYEFKQSLGRGRVTWVEGRCVSYGSTVPYAPLLALVRHNFRLGDLDTPEVIADKLGAGLGVLGLEAKGSVPYLLHLLGVKEGTEGLAGQSPEALRTRTMEILRQIAVAGSRRRTLIIAVEDLHWVDRTSEAVLASFAEMLSGGPVLLLLTYRPGYQPPWLGRSYATQMVLDRLSREDSRRVVHSIVPEERLPEQLAQTILGHADGVPFFLEELARAVAEHPDLRSEVRVPDTIHGVLTARLDRLPDDDRAMLQVASVIGKDVDLTLLAHVAELPDAALGRCLSHLQAAEFLHETAGGPARGLTFKHALTQEVAYRSLLDDVRRGLHVRVAQAIERLMPEVRERQPELLAHHYTSAGRIVDAVGYWHRAGQRALQRSAIIEAVAHLTKGLELVTTLGQAPERAPLELRLQMLLGAALAITRGWAAPEVGETMARARELSEAIAERGGESGELFFVRWGLWRFYASRADLATAQEIAEQLLKMADDESDPDVGIGAHLAAGVTNMYLGRFGQAASHFEQALSTYDPVQSRSQALRYGQDLGVGASAFLSWTLTILGDVERAATTGERALWQARATQHPPTIGLALYFVAQGHMLRREAAPVRALGDELLVLAREQSFRLYSAFGMNITGWARASTHDTVEGLVTMRQGADLFRSVGQRIGLSHRAHLGDALLSAGQLDEAEAVIAEALQEAEHTGERAFESDLRRVQGEILARRGVTDAAIAALERALEIATGQGAWLYVLRSAVALARLSPKGREPLHAVVGRFRSSLELSDLVTARNLLEGRS
jgi:DNA-binding NtrC family response regulator/tetratricopeptide (TPR) repeat protein